MRTYGDTLLTQLSSTPQGVFSRDGDALLHGGDPRWAFPDRAQMDQAKLDVLKTLIGRPLAEAPIEVVVVGDVNIEEAIRLPGLTFGALPPRKDLGLPADAKHVVFPAPTPQPIVLTHNGRADQAIGYVAWPTTDFPSDPANARALRLVEQILQLRLLDDLREKQAVTYSPQTQLSSSWDFPGYGYVSASIEAPPDKLPGIVATGRDDAKGIGFVIRDDGGRLVAAAAGYTWAGTSELKQMWVDPAHRGRGHARDQLAAFVAEAAGRGVRRIREQGLTR